MAQKYYNVKETAQLFGVSEDDVKQMLERRELRGFRDGMDWKFKSEDIERMASERAAKASPADEDEGDVLLSEVELGHSDPGLSGTVIGAERRKNPATSDIRLADSDVKLSGSEIKLADSEIKLVDSSVDLGNEKKKPAAAPRKDEVASKVSQFEELDLTLDQDLTLDDSSVAGGPLPSPKTGDSAIDLSGKNLGDDDMVLGGSGTGSDITIGGDSGISLVDPADSGLSLESPLNISPAGEESLELGEDDLLAFSSDTGGSAIKSEDDFQLTPMEEGAEADDSESGSQVIALDTESEGDDAPTMVASGGSVAAMLDEDLSGDAAMGLGPAPMMGSAGGGLEVQPDAMGLGVPLMQSAIALPEAPYTIWNIVSLVLCSLILILVGMMTYDLVRNMWSWDGVHPVNNGLMDTILSWFEK